jgi:four helix bundle protein
MQIENLKNGKNQSDELASRLLELAVSVIQSSKAYSRFFPGLHISGQIMRSITSAGANYEEGRGAESRSDFIHKLQIVLKELRESIYWLKLTHKLELIKPEAYKVMFAEASELARIIAKSIVTAKGNR